MGLLRALLFHGVVGVLIVVLHEVVGVVDVGEVVFNNGSALQLFEDLILVEVAW